ncbi:MAG: hypothetical protein LBV73_01310, partial [Paraburkholderia sp.]|nr:hypothetical protein [Paraburkholderia sp.]
MAAPAERRGGRCGGHGRPPLAAGRTLERTPREDPAIFVLILPNSENIMDRLEAMAVLVAVA